VKSVCGVLEISIGEVTTHLSSLISEEVGCVLLTLGLSNCNFLCELVLQLAILEDHEKMCNVIDTRFKSDCSDWIFHIVPVQMLY